METKLDAKLDALEVDVKVAAKWDAKNIKKIFCLFCKNMLCFLFM